MRECSVAPLLHAISSPPWVPDTRKMSAVTECSLEQVGHLALADWRWLEGKGCVPAKSSMRSKDGRPRSM